MPTIGHVAIGFAAGRMQGRRGTQLVRDLVFYGVLSITPDLDLLANVVNHPAAVPLGHRGATHSIFAALLIAIAAAFLGKLVLPGRSPVTTGIVAFLVVASHGLVDPLNAHSHGTALFWPVSSWRLTWGAFQPIPVTPVGLDALYGQGLRFLLTEALWFSPFFAYALWPRAAKRPALESERAEHGTSARVRASGALSTGRSVLPADIAENVAEPGEVGV